jgi:hypothetical protein
VVYRGKRAIGDSALDAGVGRKLPDGVGGRLPEGVGGRLPYAPEWTRVPWRVRADTEVSTKFR